ncbi:MAG: AAA family ATPase [Flavobacteriales bacterium]|jgi:predicted ATPase|nr:AAA family ATPase [Flavobacteriales bacterium]
MFKKIRINTWRQYENIDIDFHPRLTIITGANGAGKTTILGLLNRHFGWPSQLVGTPKKDKKTGRLKFFSDFGKDLFSSESSNVNRNNQNVVGNISYINGTNTNIMVPTQVGSTYGIQFSSQQPISGFHIPSHRPIYKYQNVPNISTQAISKQMAYQNYRSVKHQRYQGSSSIPKSETYFIKETLISLATFGYGNQIVSRNDEAVRIFEGFQDVLKNVLPPKLGFEKISIRIPEVILETKSGEFAMDAVSGGIASIIDLAWQIFMFENNNQPFCVTFDEPENHLHPEMQKSLLPNFLKAFPRAQFIIASHNPFIISSVPDSKVYVLNYNENNKVSSILLDNIEKSGSANDILRDVLGIESTKPEWVNNQIDEILNKYSEKGITPENIEQFKSELKRVGLEKFVHTSVADLIQKSKEK